MLRIAIDITPIRQKLSGIGIYTLNLIRALQALEFQENFQLTLAYQPSLKKWLKRDLSFSGNFPIQNPIYTLPIPVTISDFLSRFPNPILSNLEAYLGLPDILHGTDHVVYPCKSSFKILTIHDLTFIKYPQFTNSIVKNTYASRIKRCLKWTDLVITFSQNTKQEIVEYLGVESDRIFITPQASRYPPNYLVQNKLKQLELYGQYDFSQPYILFVSKLEPRKNIITLIKAFNLLKQENRIEHQLILIGQKGWGYEPILNAIATSPHTDSIYHLDYLSDELVALFYSQADVFVYPSYYEGFGLPVLEAMTLGAPVITSNTSSLPEVAGDAAILINPHDSTELAEAILKVISNSQLRQDLINKGKERAKLFSWKTTARETLKAYRTLI
ncbi:MAG: glycosyltransferase family 4 protein [Hydrococcus sp. Prado102]|nr:glycosyltransferase family 4 protein [Hydrococcus sp. Prado102]